MKKTILFNIIIAAMSAAVITGCSGALAIVLGSNDSSFSGGKNSERLPDSKRMDGEPETTENVAASNKDITICLIARGFHSQYWQAAYKGAKSAAQELGVTLEFQGPDSETDIAQQVQMMDDAVQMKPQAIGLAALDVSALNDPIKAARDAGIPIIGFDTGAPDAPAGSVVANAVTDSYRAGENAAENAYALVADKISEASGSVRIGVISQDATSERIVNRGLGFIDKITSLIEADRKTVCITGNDRFVREANTEKGHLAQVILDVVVPSNIKASQMTLAAQTLLNKEDTICVFASSDKTSEAMINGDDTLDRLGKDVIGVAFGSGVMIKNAIREGKLAGAVTHVPVEIGYQTVQIAVKAANGERVEDVDTGSLWYNAENMDNPEIADNLYD